MNAVGRTVSVVKVKKLLQRSFFIVHKIKISDQYNELEKLSTLKTALGRLDVNDRPTSVTQSVRGSEAFRSSRDEPSVIEPPSARTP